MRDDDELRLLQKFLHDQIEPLVVRLIERGIHFVQNAEWRWLALENTHQQGHAGHRLFTAAELADAHGLFAGWTGDDLNAGIEHIDLFHDRQHGMPIRTQMLFGFLIFNFRFQKNVRRTPAEELAEQALEVLADGVEGLLETNAAFNVDLFNQLFQLQLARGEIRHLRTEETRTLLKLFQFGDGVDIDVAETMDFVAQFFYFDGDGVPIHLGGLIPFTRRAIFSGQGEPGISRRKIKLQFLLRAGDERFQSHAHFAELQLKLMEQLLNFRMRFPKQFHTAIQPLHQLAQFFHLPDERFHLSGQIFLLVLQRALCFFCGGQFIGDFITAGCQRLRR